MRSKAVAALVVVGAALSSTGVAAQEASVPTSWTLTGSAMLDDGIPDERSRTERATITATFRLQRADPRFGYYVYVLAASRSTLNMDWKECGPSCSNARQVCEFHGSETIPFRGQLVMTIRPRGPTTYRWVMGVPSTHGTPGDLQCSGFAPGERPSGPTTSRPVLYNNSWFYNNPISKSPPCTIMSRAGSKESRRPAPKMTLTWRLVPVGTHSRLSGCQPRRPARGG
jgi:hypothetical protein